MTAAVPSDSNLAAEAIRALSRLRGERIIHGAGVAMSARLTLTQPLGLLQPGEHFCVLRLSRSLGMKHLDIHGWALKLPHAPKGVQDLLLDTVAGTGKVRRHVLWPRRGPLSGPVSSITHCRIGGRKVTILAVPAARQKHTLETMKHAVAMKKARWHLLAPHPVGVVEGIEVLGDGKWLEFDPTHDGAGIQPVGLIERIRHGTYTASRQVEDDVDVPGPRSKSSTVQHS